MIAPETIKCVQAPESYWSFVVTQLLDRLHVLLGYPSLLSIKFLVPLSPSKQGQGSESSYAECDRKCCLYCTYFGLWVKVSQR